jgi:hypothetical protein
VYRLRSADADRCILDPKIRGSAPGTVDVATRLLPEGLRAVGSVIVFTRSAEGDISLGPESDSATEE